MGRVGVARAEKPQGVVRVPGAPAGHAGGDAEGAEGPVGGLLQVAGQELLAHELVEGVVGEARGHGGGGVDHGPARPVPGIAAAHEQARDLFVAWGKHCDYLFAKQPWDFAFGAGSALERFTELNGHILLLGSDHDAVTYLHYAEHVGTFKDKRIVRFKVPVHVDGQRVWRDMAEVDTGDRAHANWPDRFFAQIVDALLVETGNQGGRVGNAPSVLLPARELLGYALRVMKRVASGDS